MPFGFSLSIADVHRGGGYVRFVPPISDIIALFNT